MKHLHALLLSGSLMFSCTSQPGSVQGIVSLKISEDRVPDSGAKVWCISATELDEDFDDRIEALMKSCAAYEELQFRSQLLTHVGTLTDLSSKQQEALTSLSKDAEDSRKAMEVEHGLAGDSAYRSASDELVAELQHFYQSELHRIADSRGEYTLPLPHGDYYALIKSGSGKRSSAESVWRSLKLERISVAEGQTIQIETVFHNSK